MRKKVSRLKKAIIVLWDEWLPSSPSPLNIPEKPKRAAKPMPIEGVAQKCQPVLGQQRGIHEPGKASRSAEATTATRAVLEASPGQIPTPHSLKKLESMIGAAIGYTFLPYDLVPDSLPGIGYMDDWFIWLIILFQVMYYFFPSRNREPLPR
ncbi:MAG: DUF1232 domain-containing protein [Pseudomonadota bacterium]